jgi:hypothetical protein
MPTISMFYGMLIQMYWDEHAPPHFHVIYGKYKATVNIRELAVQFADGLSGIVRQSMTSAPSAIDPARWIAAPLRFFP